jgi:hypothetical protein
MSEDRDKLKSLLLGEEIAQINAIRTLLEDQQAFTNKVSQVLDQAADQTIRTNPDFQKKFSRLDPNVLSRAIKANQKSFIDAMIPIMGPMIRQSVANAITRFIQDVNRAMEMGFSLKALKWRWQAYRSGVSFAEIVFRNTIEYQVQQVFLIDRESGLLIEYAGQEDALLQDKEAMSAMLTAIQDFVRDSMGDDGGSLSAAKLGERNVEVITGPQANLAVIIKGAYTPRLVDHLSAATEQIHVDHAHDLTDQSRWNNNPDLHLQLESLLVTKTQSDGETSSGVNFWPWVVGLLLLISWFSWQAYRDHQALKTARQELAAVAGLKVDAILPKDDGFQVTGLLDPLADTSQLSSHIQLDTRPYVSLDDTILTRRVTRILQDDRLQAVVNEGHLILNGHHQQTDQHQRQLELLAAQPGILSITDHSEPWQPPPDLAARLAAFRQQHTLPDTLQLSTRGEQLVVAGEGLISQREGYWPMLNEAFSDLDSSQLQWLDDAQLIDDITREPINFIQTDGLNETQQKRLQQVAEAFARLHRHRPDTRLKLTARSDCQGSMAQSNDNNQRRGNWLAEQLVQTGLNRELLQVETVACEQITTAINPALIGVWFEVIP